MSNPETTRERVIFQYQKEDGGGIRVIASADFVVDELALETIEGIVAMKRREIQRRLSPKFEAWP